MPVKVIGADKVAAQFAKLANISYADFMTVISQSTLSLLRNNTPVDTGELQRSWREIYRTDRTVAIGTEPAQAIKLRSIVLGTRYTRPNDFITPIAQIIFNNIESVMLSHLQKSHPYLTNIRQRGIKTTANIGGLSGTTVYKTRTTGGGRRNRITFNQSQLRSTIRRKRPTRVKASF